MVHVVDSWLDRRLESRSDAAWFAQHDLYPAASFCRILGRELLRLDSSDEEDEINVDRQARARGFEVASKGEASMNAALKKLVQFGRPSPALSTARWGSYLQKGGQRIAGSGLKSNGTFLATKAFREKPESQIFAKRARHMIVACVSSLSDVSG